jgi:hypothetical protein
MCLNGTHSNFVESLHLFDSGSKGPPSRILSGILLRRFLSIGEFHIFATTTKARVPGD